MNVSDLEIAIDDIDLFKGMDEYAVGRVLICMEAYKREYGKGSIIYHYFDPIQYAGIVLDGRVELHMYNSEENDLPVSSFGRGKMFGGAYACANEALSPIEVSASTKSTVLFLKISNLFTSKAVSCPYASSVTARVLQSTARQCIFQNKKIQIISQKQLRGKIITYIRTFYNGSSTIILPFDRQGFADFLNADRSALSRELCRMKSDGLIDFNKREITLLTKPELI